MSITKHSDLLNEVISLCLQGHVNLGLHCIVIASSTTSLIKSLLHIGTFLETSKSVSFFFLSICVYLLLFFCCSLGKLCPTLWFPWTAAHQSPLSFTLSGVCSDLCPLNQWCYLTISSSAFSFCLQPFPESGSVLMSQLFTSGNQSIGASASAIVLPMHIQGWFPLGLTGLISLQSKGRSRVFSSTTVWKYQFFSAQPSLYMHIYAPLYLYIEKEMATHSSILAWKIPWTEEHGGLQSMGSQRVWHGWATNTFSSVQWLSRVRLFTTPWKAAHQASLATPAPGTNCECASHIYPSAWILLRLNPKWINFLKS